MRRLMIPAVLLTFGAIGLVVSAPSQAQPDCTEQGTPARDVMAGSRGPDIMCALGGDDYVHGNGGKDIIRGGSGNDVIVGGKGKDKLRGRANDDRLFAVDGKPGDFLDGGGGMDQCFADHGDRVHNCEKTFRGATLREANAISDAFFGGLSLAEDLIETPMPTVPPPGGGGGTDTVTVITTKTKTVQFPPCTPPPVNPPAPC